MHAQSVAVANWWAAPERNSPEWIANYQESLQSRQRTMIAEIVKHYSPDSVFEVGCHCGPNLIRIAHDVPSVSELFGIDANADAVEAGRIWTEQAGVQDRVRMSVGRFPDDTERLPDKCADVVLSCYTLAYLAPIDLDAALFELGRLAARAVIIAEPMTNGPSTEISRTQAGYLQWAHDIGHAAKWIQTFRGMQARLVKVQPPIDYMNAILVLER